MDRRALTAVALAAFAAPAAAQEFFSSDGESGTFLSSEVPPGPWTAFQSFNPQLTFTTSLAAAHRGTKGISLNDPDGVRGVSPPQLRVDASFGTSTQSHYLRMWWRISAFGQGLSTLVLIPGPVIGFSIMDLELDHDRHLATLTGAGVGLGAYTIDPAPGQLVAGRWYLVEMTAEGLGTTQGARRMYIDGRLAAQRTGIDWTGWGIDGLSIGEPWDNSTFEGELHFDDVRVSRGRPPASRFVVRTETATVKPGGCVAVAVSLESSGGVEAPPFDPAPLELSDGAAGGAFFTDAECSQAAAGLALTPAAPKLTVYYRGPQPGAVTLSCRSTDYLEGTAQLQQWRPEDERVFRAGCGCASSGAWLCLAPVLAWALRRRALRRSE